MKTVYILDTGISNIYSIKIFFERLKYKIKLIETDKDFNKAKLLVFPGVGSFPVAIKFLKKKKLIDGLKNYILCEKPFIGICLGMQLLFEKSEEFGDTLGLNIIKGKVKKFNQNNSNLDVHIGWNNLYLNTSNKFAKNICDFSKKKLFYFVHSYYALPDEKNIVLSQTKFGDTNFCSALYKKNLIAFQFHPEKSGENGFSLVNQFLKKVEND